jgi:uncharacterized protein YwlG (UPF0340 family)
VNRRSGRDRIGKGQCELVEQVGIGMSEVEGNRVRGVIGDDSSRQIAAFRVLQTLLGADQRGVELAYPTISDPEGSLQTAPVMTKTR